MTLVNKYSKLVESARVASFFEDPYKALRLVPKPEVTKAANQIEAAA